MYRTAALAAAFALMSALPALAQEYPHEPPPGYMAAPPGEWAHRPSWEHMDQRRREAYFDEWRHEHWRCDHGDRAACHWMHDHA